MTKVLLVEDEPDNAKMIARTMRMRGFDVVVAMDGEAAVEKAQEHRPDVILMDFYLPGDVSGLDATRRIKSSPETSGTPLIMLSALGAASFERDSIEAGANDTDEKPVDFNRLIGKIKSLLNQV
jgi:DNA-binding response OmpR family regulator